MRPILFRIPFVGFPIFAYGFMIMLGFLGAIWYASRRAKQKGIDPNIVMDLGMLLVFTGVIGTRIFYVIQYWDAHFANAPWWKVFAIWEGGLVFWGGLITSFPASYWFLKRHNLPALATGDLLIPGVPIGLAFGRLGCFLNGCCWGRYFESGCQFPAVRALTDPPSPAPAFVQHSSDSWSTLMEIPKLSPGAEFSYPVHPTQLYSFFAALALCGLLHVLYKYRTRAGQVFIGMLALYPIQRFFIETFRGDHQTFYSLFAWIGGIFSDSVPAASLTALQLKDVAADGSFIYSTYLTSAQNMVFIIVPLAIGMLVWLHFKTPPLDPDIFEKNIVENGNSPEIDSE